MGRFSPTLLHSSSFKTQNCLLLPSGFTFGGLMLGSTGSGFGGSGFGGSGFSGSLT